MLDESEVEPTSVAVVVACASDGCEQHGVAIEMLIFEGSRVQCGTCLEAILNVEAS